MGKATIVSDDGSGLYTIEIKHNTTVASSRISDLNSAISSTEEKISEEEAKDEPDQSVLAALNFRVAALQIRVQQLTDNAINLDYQTSAWCADYTQGLSGDVGTIEPGSDRNVGINIQPGYSGESAWNHDRDGQATPFLTFDVADAMRNFAMLPALKKWRPTYRYGTISNINYVENTCSVTIDSQTSLGLDINYQSVYTDVPINYMSCNAAAFENNDRVIIRFIGSDPTTAEIIGFIDNPKGCSPAIIITYESQAIAWDIDADDIMAIHGLSQPASLSNMINAMAAMGYDTQNYQDTTVIGTCNISDEIKLYEFGDLENIYGAYHEIDENEDLDLVDTAETYTATVQGTVIAVYNQLTYLSFTRYITADYDTSGTVGVVYAACMDDSEVSKRKPTLYHSTGEIAYVFDYFGAEIQSESTYTVTVDYTKDYHYKSTFNSLRDSNDVISVEVNYSGSDRGYILGTPEFAHDSGEAIEVFNEFKTDVHVSIKVAPIQNIRKDNIAIVIEQPVIYNNDNDNVWGFCDIWATNQGTLIDPDEPGLGYEYDYLDLAKLDTDKMYEYFGTTHSDDMDDRQTSAGLEVIVFSIE